MKISIHDISSDGPGVGRAPDGKIVFVPFTAPGDEVEALLQQDLKRFSTASLQSVLRPSSNRVTPPCSVFGLCGGCQWQHIPYALQWETKRKLVATALTRNQVADVPDPALWSLFPAPATYGYRTRIQLHQSEGKIGFFASGSHDIVETKSCAIAHEKINEFVHSSNFHRFGTNWDRLELDFHNGQVTAATGIDSRVFRQVNPEQNAKLHHWLREFFPKSREVWDLYGGDGNLSLALGPPVKTAHIVDRKTPASQTQHAEIRLIFHSESVSAFLRNNIKKYSRSKENIGVLIDPPRQGMGEDAPRIVQTLSKLPVFAIALISCNPNQWAREVKLFSKSGWKLSRVAVFDFFPQTVHTECAGLLTRS